MPSTAEDRSPARPAFAEAKLPLRRSVSEASRLRAGRRHPGKVFEFTWLEDMATAAASRKKAASETKAIRGIKAPARKKKPAKDKLFKRNLAAFERKFEAVHKLLTSFRKTHSTLVDDENGDADIEFRGEGFYGTGAKRHARRQIDEFLENPVRVRISPPGTGTLDDVAGTGARANTEASP